MDLTKLFETQKVLDQKIYDRFLGLKVEPWDWKILALLTELGECANEHRGFKKWSEDQEPRTKVPVHYECIVCGGVGYLVHDNGIVTEDCIPCKAEGKFHIGDKNPLLEEYVDCLHFILSIGLEIGFTEIHLIGNYQRPEDVTEMFNCVFEEVITLKRSVSAQHYKFVSIPYSQLFESFIALGKMLGFDWEKIEAAYYAKNEINHARQNNGY